MPQITAPLFYYSSILNNLLLEVCLIFPIFLGHPVCFILLYHLVVYRKWSLFPFQVSSSDLVSTWTGQSEKLVRELFDHALANDGISIIFIDEIDSLCRIRHQSEDDGNRRIKV